MLTPLVGGGFLVESPSEKGEAFLETWKDRFAERGRYTAPGTGNTATQPFDLKRIKPGWMIILKMQPGTVLPPVVWAAAPAPLSARPATALILWMKAARRVVSAGNSGMPAGSGNLPTMPQAITPATCSPSVTATGSCTSSSITTTNSARPSAPVAGAVSGSVRWGLTLPVCWKRYRISSLSTKNTKEHEENLNG